MPKFQPDGGKNKDPATFEDYLVVREGKGTPEQIAMVLEALKDTYSPLRLELGDEGPRIRWMMERKYAKPIPASEDYSSAAHKNVNVVIEYLRAKRDAGVLSEQEVQTIIQASPAEKAGEWSRTPTHYAMSVARMMRAITNLHPELASEVKSLPISRKR